MTQGLRSGRSDPGRVLFRVDAGAAVGAGHLVRCLALAEELRVRGFACWFELGESAGDLRSWVETSGHHLIFDDDGGRPATERHPERFECAVLDHYLLGEPWLIAASSRSAMRVVMDDMVDRRLPADVVVNASPGVAARAYDDLCDPGTTLLLGTRYALLRSAFVHARSERWFGPVDRVLVSLGGGASGGVASTAVAAARLALPAAHVVLITGTGEPDAVLADGNLSVRANLDGRAMAAEMVLADLAIGAGGTAAWERCMLGLPSVVLRLAPNQDPVVDGLRAASAAVDGGSAESVSLHGLAQHVARLAGDPEARARLSENARRLVDGKGARRIANAIDGVKVRRAILSDARLLWEWANDPVTRANSFIHDPIPWNVHKEWLRGRLQDPNSRLLIGVDGRGPLGQVRFDLDGEVEVSVSVARDRRDEGLGRQLLKSALNYLKEHVGTPEVKAKVLPDNHASRRLFEGAGFAPWAEADDRVEYRLEAGWTL